MNTTLINHRIVVGNPALMIRDEELDDPICPRCHDSFIECICPKPWSKVETDGFQIKLEADQLIAYPTQETYKEEMLWITSKFHQLRCGLCTQTLEPNEDWNEVEADELVEAFFDVHKNCYNRHKEKVQLGKL
ncbi:MAG: hypothetical protein IIA59_06095 [Candidatus Marinimicrobia bacterium]|nr:hypothetical protein [Candidatus Neomarinimicrobiota bacterium]